MLLFRMPLRLEGASVSFPEPGIADIRLIKIDESDRYNDGLTDEGGPSFCICMLKTSLHDSNGKKIGSYSFKIFFFLSPAITTDRF